jgi:subtilisin-like proprotein convertase family protein
MRKIYTNFLSLFFLLVCAGTINAQTNVIIPAANTNSGSTRFPLATYWGYERAAMIYTPAQIGAQGSVQAISFYMNAANTPREAVNVRVYLKRRSTTFTAISTYASEISGATLVYGPTTIPAATFVAGQWITLNLATAFPYLTETDNLEVIVETNATGGGNGETTTSKQFRYTAQPNTQFFQGWAADTNPPTGDGTLSLNRPNIRLTIQQSPCVPGSLTGGTIVGPATACPGGTISLGVSGASFGEDLTRQWESATASGGPWTPVASATDLSYSPTITGPVWFRRKITCGGTDAYSAPHQVTFSAPTQCYCAASFLSTRVEPITLVNLGGINNTSSNSTAAPAYENFRAIVGNVYQAATHTITLKGNTSGPYTNYYKVYFDWNQDGDFLDANEEYAIGSISSSTGLDATQLTGNINVPATALVGSTGMRVVKVYGTEMPAANISCIVGGTADFGQIEDYTVNVGAPLCPLPASLTAATVIPGVATVSWTATTPIPTVGYQWVLTSTNASATANIVQQGNTANTVTSVNVNSLNYNTTYYAWVRTDCGAGALGPWVGPFAFTTLCDVIATVPYNETFEAASATRGCWRNEYVSGNVNWIYRTGAPYGAVTTAHGGTLNASFNADNYNGNATKLVSPIFSFAGLTYGATLNFWYAKQMDPDWGDVDELRVYYRTAIGGAWTLVPGAEYTNSIGAWRQVEIQLPASINSTVYQIAFEATSNWGFGVVVDDVNISATPSCIPPADVKAFGISTTEIVSSFVSPGNSFIIEYGTVGFTPGTGATAGGGTIVAGPVTGSPYTITGLTAGTTYDIYVRRNCGAGDFSANKKVTTSTLCAAINIPYVQNFESSVVPNFPTCTSMEDVNGNSGSTVDAEGGRWITFSSTNPQQYVSPTKSLLYHYDLLEPTRAADDWFYLQGLNLTGGTEYRLKFYYKGAFGPTYVEKFEVKYGTKAYSANQTNLLYSNMNVTTAFASPFDSVIVDFTPPANGTYYIGFHALSEADQAFLVLDDVSVAIAPKVDAGAISLTLPAMSCPTNNVTFQARVKNYNIKTLDFAVNNVEVIAAIRTPSTTSDTVRTKLTSGTLAAGAITDLYLSPNYNFANGGTYTIKLYTSSPLDPINGNDTIYRTVVINPLPLAPVITVASSSVCTGGITQLSVPAGVQSTATFSGTTGNIALAIPDNSPAGITSTINATGVPVGSTITGITVTLNATHTFVGDFVINLVAPNGKILNLFNARGGSGDNLTNTVFNQSSTTALTTSVAPFTGTFRPDAALGVGPTSASSNAASFAELYTVAPGEWKLALSDGGLDDFGTLLNWSISFNYSYVPSLVWTPAANLFTDAAATQVYVAGSSAYTVFAKPTATTVYTATATGAGGCSRSASRTIELNAYTPVVIAASMPDTLCISDPAYTLQADPAGGVWSGIGVSGNNFIPAATAVGKFVLTYTYTNAGGCVTTLTRDMNVKDCPERYVLLRDTALYVYPNPSNGQFNIRINSVLYEKMSMRVYSASGLLIKTEELSNLRYGNVLPVDLRGLAGGLYFIQFYYNNGVRASDKTFRVIIGHK